MHNDDQETSAVDDENLKRALHFNVGKLCEYAVLDRENRNRQRFVGSSQCLPVTFTKPFMAMLSDTVWRLTDNWANDLEAFASHAKRSVINADDVRLLARRSPSLTRLLEQAAELPSATDATTATTAGQKQKGVKRKNAPTPGEIEQNDTSRDGTREEAPIIIDDDTGSPKYYHQPYPTIEEDATASPKHPTAMEEDDLDAVIMMLSDEDLIRNQKASGPSLASKPSTSISGNDDDEGWFIRPTQFRATASTGSASTSKQTVGDIDLADLVDEDW